LIIEPAPRARTISLKTTYVASEPVLRKEMGRGDLQDEWKGFSATHFAETLTHALKKMEATLIREAVAVNLFML